MPHPFRLRRSRAARTPLFAALRRALLLARCSQATGLPPRELLAERAELISRRRFLTASLAAAGAAGLAACGVGPAAIPPTATVPPAAPTPTAAPRIAIVGGGMAGLRAAYVLQQAGLRATVYEGSARAGGRIFSRSDLLAPGLVTELGGEFINSSHTDMLDLAAAFDLELIDTQAESERELIGDAYFFGGEHYTEAQVAEALQPFAARIQADYDSTGDAVDYQHPEPARALDTMSISAYLDTIGMDGWVRQLVEVAYVAEFGMQPGEQSALNMIFMIAGAFDGDDFSVLGASDERYKVRGGNQQIVDELARRLDGQLAFGERLEAVSGQGSGYRLSFAGPGGAHDVDADAVIFALPFTLLRAVDLRVELPEVKRRSIAELGYGANAKVMAGFTGRVWREQGYGGNIYSDQPFQVAWDNSRQQDGTAGGITFYSGGQGALDVGAGSAAEQVARLLPGLDAAYPGLAAAHNGRAERFHWPSFAWTQGSYACYRVGQWTSIGGAEFEPVGRLFFAGEHCSVESQGYMNGAAETGRRAAEALLAAVGARAG